MSINKFGYHSGVPAPAVACSLLKS